MAYYCNMVLIALNNLYSETKEGRQVLVQFPVFWETGWNCSTSQEILLFHIGFYTEPEKQMSLEMYQ